MSSDQYGPEPPGTEGDLSDNPVLEQQRAEQEWELQRIYAERRRRTAIMALSAVLVLAVAAATCYIVLGPEAIADFLEEYWPVMAALPAGWLLGRWAVGMLYRPSGKLVVCLDPSTHIFRAVFIPDAMFRYFDQSGNNVLYHTPLGMPVYVAERIDTESGIIEYSWIHELDALTVMTREEFFVNFSATTEDVLRENLQIKGYPYTIALGYVRKTLR